MPPMHGPATREFRRSPPCIRSSKARGRTIRGRSLVADLEGPLASRLGVEAGGAAAGGLAEAVGEGVGGAHRLAEGGAAATGGADSVAGGAGESAGEGDAMGAGGVGGAAACWDDRPIRF